MSTIELFGCKQAPGVTTLALALGAVLDPAGGAIVIEADPQGGDLSALLGRPAVPGLLSAAAAGRHGAAIDVGSHLQPLPAGGRALLAPSDPTQVSAALAAAAGLFDVAAAAAAHVVVDRGRGGPSPIDHGAALLVCHPTVVGIEQARVRCEMFDAAGRAVWLVLTSHGPYGADEVAAALGRPVVGIVPHDPRGAAALALGDRNLRRSPLIRAVASLAAELSSRAERSEPAWH